MVPSPDMKELIYRQACRATQEVLVFLERKKQEKWDRYFLDECLFRAQHLSKDPSTQVAACVVGPDKEPRVTGFNGFARGIGDYEARLNTREIKNKLMVHAEMNAILTAARIGVSVKDCTMYLVATNKEGLVWGGPPCISCTMGLIQAGISTVVSYPFKDVPSRWHDNIMEAREYLEEAGIRYREIQ